MTNTADVLTDPEQREGVKDNHLRTADAFIEAMRATSEPWHSDPTSWIHRGHGNADWFLRPRAVRDGATAFARYGIDDKNTSWTERKVVHDEMLDRFGRRLDASGMVIPSPSPRVSRDKAQRFYGGPVPEVYPLMALAQHHGLPTMLLDWTRRALFAAYFAAMVAADPDAKERWGSHISVVSMHLIDIGGKSENAPHWWEEHGVLLYEAPGGTNPNLRAQAGVFTVSGETGNESLEEVIARRMANGVPSLLRTTLPRTEAPRLLRLLSYEGIDGASMFPGADGVVRAMREEALWDRRRSS